MNQRLKAYGVSFILHALFLTGFVWLSQTTFYKDTKPLEIDLSLLEFRKEENIQELKTTHPKTETKSKVEAFKTPKATQKMSTPQEILQKATSKPEATELQDEKTMPVEENTEKPKTAKEQISTVAQSEKSQAVASEPAGIKGSKETGIQASISQEGSGRASKTLETSHAFSEEEQRQLYLKEKLSVISQIIQKNISYPPIARRMGWEGRVVLSIRLYTDGTVREIKVLESSGYEVLDRNAVDTVRRVAGLFPKPPVEVVVKVPVNYRLE